MFNFFHPIYFPIWLPQQFSSGTKNGLAEKKVSYIFVLIPSTNACYLTIAGYGFFFGALRGPCPTLRFGGACGLGVGTF